MLQMVDKTVVNRLLVAVLTIQHGPNTMFIDLICYQMHCVSLFGGSSFLMLSSDAFQVSTMDL